MTRPGDVEATERLSIAEARALPPDRAGAWFCACGAGFMGDAAMYPDALRSHAVFRAEYEPGRAHDPGLATFRPDRAAHFPAQPVVGGGRAEEIGVAWLAAVEAAEREHRNLDVAWKMRHNGKGAVPLYGPERTWIAIGWDENGGPWHEADDIVEALRGLTEKMTPRPLAATPEDQS